MPDKTIPALWQNTLDQTAATIPPGATLSHAPTGGGGGGGGSGTVTSVALTSTNLTITGSPITTSGTLTADLPATAVTPGTYNYATITLDAYGRATFASSGAAPTGTVTSINLTSTAGTITPTGGQVTTSGSINVDITGLPPTNGSTSLGAPTKRWANLTLIPAGSIQFTDNSTIDNEYSHTVGVGPVFTDSTHGVDLIFNMQSLLADRTATWQNSSGTVAWLTDIPSSLPPSGTAGGDLSGTYPNPTVAKINTVALGTTTATAGNLLIGSGSAWVTNAMTGDITITSAGVTAIGANKVTTTTINANAVTLAKLATQADQTALVNISGSTAVPTASTFDAAQIQRFYYAGSTSGTSTYTATLSPAPSAYQDGAQYIFTVTSTNVGSGPTINFNSLGALTVKLNGASIASGQLVAGATYQ